MCLGRLHVVTGLNADTQSLSVLYLFLGSDDVTLPFQFRRRGKVPVDILSVGTEQFCRVCPFEPVEERVGGEIPVELHDIVSAWQFIVYLESA